MIEFDDNLLKKYKESFNVLDEDASGAIGLEELETPLIGLGLACNSGEVQQMIQDVDDDHSGEVEFDEFLSIVRNNKLSAHPIDKFFRNMADGEVGHKDLGFAVNVQDIRRTYMRDAILTKFGNYQSRKNLG